MNEENIKIIWDGSLDAGYSLAEEYKTENEGINEFCCEELAAEQLNIWRDDERKNLDVKTERDIILIADLGLDRKSVV